MTVSLAHRSSLTARRGWILAVIAVILALALPFAPNEAHAEAAWSETAQQIVNELNTAGEQYHAGDYDTAKETVKHVRYTIFVGSGFETAIGSQVSGASVNKADMSFGRLTQAISKRDDAAFDEHLAILSDLLVQDAAALDGKGEAKSVEDMTVSPGKWGQVASTMVGLLDEGQATFESGDIEGGKDTVNEAYYGHYETTGFEKVTMSRVSGARVSGIELEFALIKKAMTENKTDEVAERIGALKPMLIEDANTLDGFDPESGSAEGSSGGATIFVASLSVILREGLEAILVVAAVIAFLVKAGHSDKTKVVWAGAALAIGISVVLAILLSRVATLAGKNQELIEGVTALIAVVMLIWVSNWMIGKSSQSAWDKYLKNKTSASLSQGSLFSLAFVAFLAVLREGAETILFYQPILAMAGDDMHVVWLGLVIGAVILIAVFIGIQKFSLRIPLRPFFIVTSILLAIMAFTFTGSGIKELQEADVVSATPIDSLPTIDLLGVYPRVENLAAQGVVLAIIAALFAIGYHRNKRNQLAKAEAE